MEVTVILIARSLSMILKIEKGRLPKQEYGIRSSEIKIKNLKLSV